MTLRLDYTLPGKTQLQGRSNALYAIPVPEPAPFISLGIGLVAIAAGRIRRK